MRFMSRSPSPPDYPDACRACEERQPAADLRQNLCLFAEGWFLFRSIFFRAPAVPALKITPARGWQHPRVHRCESNFWQHFATFPIVAFCCNLLRGWFFGFWALFEFVDFVIIGISSSGFSGGVNVGNCRRVIGRPVSKSPFGRTSITTDLVGGGIGQWPTQPTAEIKIRYVRVQGGIAPVCALF